MNKRFSYEDWFSPHIPNWQRWFAPLVGQPHCSVLEIGSFEGRSALWLLENVLTGAHARLVCIDPYSQEGLADSCIQTKPSAIEDNFRFNVLSNYNNVTHHHTTSFKALCHLNSSADTRFDAIYIDGSHEAADVLADAILAWPLLRAHGLLIFDDYLWRGVPATKPPQYAIDSFLDLMQGKYTLLYKGVQVAILKAILPNPATIAPQHNTVQ